MRLMIAFPARARAAAADLLAVATVDQSARSSFDFRTRVDFVRIPGVIKLRSGEASDRNPERRTGHVVERDLMAERDRRGNLAPYFRFLPPPASARYSFEGAPGAGGT